MPQPLIVQTLTEKRAEILGQIKAYEAQIAHAKHDLAHVNATTELFAAPERQHARHIASHGFFKKGEIADICVRHLVVDAEQRKFKKSSCGSLLYQSSARKSVTW